MFRPTVPADTPALLTLTEGTGVFKPHELEALQEVLDDYHAVNHTFGHTAYTWEEAGTPVGFAYYAPTAMTDRTWELWWIAVEKSQQGRGLGRLMLDFVEQDVRRNGGRLLLIETSSLLHYEPTRRFYRKQGYALSSQITDFYADGDDKVIFAKRISTAMA